MGCINTWMALDMKVFGKRINRTAEARSNGQIVPCTMETTSKAKSMERDCLDGLMVLSIKESS